MGSIDHTPLVSLPPLKYLQPTAFARAIGVTRGTVCYWIRNGRLPSVTQQRNGYFQIPSHYIDLVQRGELPLAPANRKIPVLALHALHQGKA